MKVNNICSNCVWNETCVMCDHKNTGCHYHVTTDGKFTITKEFTYLILGLIKSNIITAEKNFKYPKCETCEKIGIINNLQNEVNKLSEFNNSEALKKQIEDLAEIVDNKIHDISVKDMIIDELEWKLNFTQKMIDKLIAKQ